MMSRKCFYWAVVSILLIGASAQAKTNDFSVDPAPDWHVNPTGKTADFDWSSTELDVNGRMRCGNKGGTAYTNRQYFADTNLGGFFDLSQDLQFSAEFRIDDTGQVGGNNRFPLATAFIGFFDSTDMTITSNRFGGAALGIMIVNRSSSDSTTHRVRGFIGDNSDGVTYTEYMDPNDASQIIIINGRAYDPFVGNTYRVNMFWEALTRTLIWTITSDEVEVLDNAGVPAVPQYLTLTEEQVATIGSFDSFGLTTRTKLGDYYDVWMDIAMDNVTYLEPGAYIPAPYDGEMRVRSTQETVSWSNQDLLKCDLYFGTDPNVLNMTKVTITDPAGRETVAIPEVYTPLENLNDYYWAVDGYVGVLSDPNDPNSVIIIPDNPNRFGEMWTFRVNDNEPPVVDIGPDQYLWLGKDGDPSSATLVATPIVTDDGLPPATMTYQWAQLAGPAIVVTDPNDLLNKDITVVLTELSNDYQFQLTVSDGDFTVESAVARVVLAADSCAASAQQPGFSYSLGDANQDCYVDLNDFSEMALSWLDCKDLGGCP